MVYRLHYAPDNASLIIRLALEELGLPYETELVDRSAGQNRSPAYLRINPAGRIPTLVTPDGPISETGAILLWLAETHHALLPPPGDPARGAALNWLFFISNTLHADAIAAFYTHRYGPSDATRDIRAALRKRLTRHLGILETEALPRLGSWANAEPPSAIDLYIAAILRWLQLYPADDPVAPDMTQLPRLFSICARLETRASVTALCAAEGMGPNPFTAPTRPNPPEGTVI